MYIFNKKDMIYISAASRRKRARHTPTNIVIRNKGGMHNISTTTIITYLEKIAVPSVVVP